MAVAAHDDRRFIPLFGLWFVSVTATLGSLFLGEVMHLPPCVLCWYQRICMFPLAVVATVGLLSRDVGVVRYAWPFAATGLALAAYHNLLYYGVIPESITPCTAGASCTERQIEWLGFVTIPLMALLAFSLAAGSLIWFGLREKSRR